MNKNFSPNRVAEYYDISGSVVHAIRNGQTYKEIPPSEPDWSVEQEFRSYFDKNLSEGNRALSNVQAGEIKYIAQNTGILAEYIGKYYGLGVRAIHHIKNGTRYAEVEPVEPDFNPQEEFIDYFGETENIYSNRMYLSAKGLAEVKWLMNNFKTYQARIEELYGINDLYTIKQSHVWIDVQPRVPENIGYMLKKQAKGELDKIKHDT